MDSEPRAIEGIGHIDVATFRRRLVVTRARSAHFLADYFRLLSLTSREFSLHWCCTGFLSQRWQKHLCSANNTKTSQWRLTNKRRTSMNSSSTTRDVMIVEFYHREDFVQMNSVRFDFEIRHCLRSSLDDFEVMDERMEWHSLKKGREKMRSAISSMHRIKFEPSQKRKKMKTCEISSNNRAVRMKMNEKVISAKNTTNFICSCVGEGHLRMKRCVYQG